MGLGYKLMGMKELLLGLLLTSISAFSQSTSELQKIKPSAEYENIHVMKIADDDFQTSFLIWIKDEVKLHKHAEHTENIYVLKGKGEMILNDEKFVIKKGDYLNIPKGSSHALKVLSSSPMQVLSIQSPSFTGKDRIYISE